MFICATSFAQFTSSEGAAIENSNSGKNGFYIQYNSIGSICTLGNEHESTLYGREWEYLKERINDRMEGITFGYNRRSKVSSFSMVWLCNMDGIIIRNIITKSIGR